MGVDKTLVGVRIFVGVGDRVGVDDGFLILRAFAPLTSGTSSFFWKYIFFAETIMIIKITNEAIPITILIFFGRSKNLSTSIFNLIEIV